MFRRQTATPDLSTASPAGHTDGQPLPDPTPAIAALLPGSTLTSRKAARQAHQPDLPKPPDQIWINLGEQDIRYPPQGDKLGSIRKCTVAMNTSATHHRITWEDGTTDIVMIRGSGLKESIRHLGVVPHAQLQANGQRALEQLDRRPLQQRGGMHMPLP